MTDLPPLLTEALIAIGPETEARIDDLIGDFLTLPLSEDGRLSALAAVVAAIATTRYRRHRDVFIAALRSWALEISIAGAAQPPRIAVERCAGRIGEAQDVLLSGIDSILRAMVAAGSEKHHRLVTELAVMAQLLGRHDAHSVHLVITAASSACGDPDWRSGERVPVSFCDGRLPLTRDASIAAIAPRGTA